MANHTQQLLNTWFSARDDFQWVLATIIEIDGSSYRKPGAMMMINDIGKYYGLLSGGCLESDIMRQARQCWTSNTAKIIQYDMREEEDIAWQMGIGCGGLVRILLQPVTKQNNYLELEGLRELVNNNKTCEYSQSLPPIQSSQLPKSSHSAAVSYQLNKVKAVDIKQQKSHTKLLDTHFIHHISPVIHLAIIGGGVDAIPVANIATSLGWQVSVVDHRTAYARKSDFPSSTQLFKHSLITEDKAMHTWLTNIDAAVVMTHNVKLDAEALQALQHSSAQYLGLLGPSHRTERVLKHAKLEREELKGEFANPIGLKLGGELPESIALSIVSEVHAFLAQASARSYSLRLNEEPQLNEEPKED
jgi:xanthine/CO dehydrogenase XdhC/CoxF family maturation factor